MHTTSTPQERYLRPGRFTNRVFNPLVRSLARRGVSLAGSRELRVLGRSSGQVRTTVVNVLDHDGRRYLVAPRGSTQWVRNLRAAGGVGELRIGRRVEPIAAVELTDDAKVDVIRAYLRRWSWEVGQFFEGLTAEATDAEITAVAPGFPVFVLQPRAGGPEPADGARSVSARA